RFERGLARYWAHVIFRIFARADRDLLRAVDHLLYKCVVNPFRNDCARAGGTLLPLIAERRLRNAFDRGIDIGFIVDDRGVLAAHFEHGALDPDLAWTFLPCRLADDEADFLRARKCDEARLRIFHHRVA